MLIKENGVFFSLLLVVVLCGMASSAQATEVRLGTAAPGSFSHFAGRVLCRMINQKVTDTSCQQIVIADTVDKLTNLQSGSIDISLIDSRVLLDATNKSSQFEFTDTAYNGLRTVAPLFATPIVLVARHDAGINSLDDLRGKRLNIGVPGSIQTWAAEKIMQAKRWTEKDFTLLGTLPPIKSQDAKAFCYGTMQAMVHIGIHPDFSLRHLLTNCDGGLVGMDDSDVAKLIKTDPALWKIEIPAGTYPSHPEKEVTFGTQTWLVASDTFDSDMVYDIVAAIDENQEFLKKVHHALSLFSIKAARHGIATVPLHPGAAKYFDEQ